MLSAQQEKDGFSQPLSLGAWAKVVGSIEGLRHKLEDLTISNIDDTQETLRILSRRLSELQKSLERLAAIKEQWIKVEAAKNEVQSNTLSIAELESIQKPPKLHTLGQLRNLILLPRLSRSLAALDGSSEKRNSEISSRAQRQKQAVESSLVMASAAHEHRQENDAASSRSTSVAVNDEAEKSSVQPEENGPMGESFRPLAQQDTVVTDTRTIEKNIEPSPFSVPQSQTSSEFEFDQRLLNDLIKDYGEFVIPSSPAMAEEPTIAPQRASSSQPITPAEFPLIENVTIQRNLPNTRQEGDLDRKLKKLMKDYGEYDLYSDHSSRKYRTAAVAAFAILALVLAGIYFFSPARDAIPMIPSAVNRSESASDVAQPTGDAAMGGGSSAEPRPEQDVSEADAATSSPGLRAKSAVTKNKK
jgi:hypothetical protein